VPNEFALRAVEAMKNTALINEIGPCWRQMAEKDFIAFEKVFVCGPGLTLSSMAIIFSE
jgi:hypothetical protein